MRILKTISAYRSVYKQEFKTKTIGFVPTMGFLHEGHFSLVRESVKNNDITVVSIFVNPKQFAPDEDLSQYPRNIDKDIESLEREGVNVLFMPNTDEMFSPGNVADISINDVYTNRLCGRYREQHFEGVALIVLKLFNVIQPNNAYFGLKDYQQYQLIKQMVKDFNLNIKVIGMPIIREINGLAMSSRNAYLSSGDRKLAACIQEGLLYVVAQVNENIDVQYVSKIYFEYLSLKSDKFRVQYIEIYNRNLEEIKSFEKGNMFIGVAVYLGDVRLIDNILF